MPLRSYVAAEAATHDELFGAERAGGVYAGGTDCGDGRGNQGRSQDYGCRDDERCGAGDLQLLCVFGDYADESETGGGADGHADEGDYKAFA